MYRLIVAKAPRLRHLLAELRRRHVFRVAIVYAATVFVALQSTQLMAEGLDLPAWVFRAITLVSLVGFPVALVLAWALELTPEGVKRTRHVVSNPGLNAPSSPGTSWWTTLIGVFVVLLFAGGGWMALSEPSPRYDSIAVLPFVDLNPEYGDGYLGDGLAEELINALGNVTALKVAARTSAFTFKGRETDVRDIGRTLGVATVLEGSVRRNAEQVRIVAQLVDATTGFRIWGGEYEGGTGDLFALQNLIAAEIVERLAVELGAVDVTRLRRGGSRDALAYELYMRARQRWAGRKVPELKLALDEMRHAVQIDPEFALAWSGLADVITALARRDPDARALRSEARGATIRALALAPDLPEAWASLGILAGELEFEWETAERALRRAVTMRPSYAQAHQWLADVQRYLGQFDKATASYERAVALDPLSEVFRRKYVAHVARFGDPVRALMLMEQLVAEWPSDDETLARLATFRQLPLDAKTRGDYAVAWATSIGFSRPEQACLVVDAIEGHISRPEAFNVLDEIERELGFIPELSEFAAALEDRERTLAMLERSMEGYEPSLLGIGSDPLYSFVADDPRFTAIVEQQRLPRTVASRSP